MSLKRLSALLLIGCFVQHFSIAEHAIAGHEEGPLSGLNWTLIQIVCEANQDLSVCQSISRLKAIQKQYGNAYEILSDWQIALRESYTSEALPYIEESCAQDPVASHMTHACESFRQLKRAKRGLERAESDINEMKMKLEQLRSQMNGLNEEISKGDPVRTQDELKDLIDRLGINETPDEAASRPRDLRELRGRLGDKRENLRDDIEDEEDDWEIEVAEEKLRTAKKEWRAIRKVTMETACNLKEGPEAFCNWLNNVKTQQEIVYSIEKGPLACIREQTSAQVEQYISDLCTNKENRSSYYYAEICRDFPRINKPLLPDKAALCVGT